MIDLSVVIGTFNQAPVLEQVLRSFADQTHPSERFEVVVVDSASVDDTPAVCEPTRYPFPLRYVRKPNTGKASARNVGLATAAGPIVLLSDADTIAEATLVAAHLDALDDFPGAVIVGQQFAVDGPVRSADAERACLNPHWPRGRRLSWRQFVTGNAALSRKALLDAGGFDEGFRGYGYEDYELGYRLTKRGARFVFEPSAVSYHYHPGRYRQDLVRKREAGRSAVHFARRHPSWALRFHLGLTPVNRALYGRISAEGWLLRACSRLQGRDSATGRLARHLLLEVAYQHGALEAWRERVEAGTD